MLLVQWLRFLSIVLGVIVFGLGMFLIWIQKTKNLTFGPNSWDWGQIIFLILAFGAVGVPLAMYDSVVFDWGQHSILVPSSGVTLSGDSVSFGVYWDVTATQRVTEIQWGEIEAGGKANVEVWIKNEGLVNLYCQASWLENSWDPPGAFTYFTMIWHFGDAPIQPGRTRKILVELLVDADIIDVNTFFFTININGDDTPPP